ncbi:MAG: hypothetical protein KF901_22800 [Myxococcales bacterium]|nr:hypothetical protein [Myxococcales bacterium]
MTQARALWMTSILVFACGGDDDGGGDVDGSAVGIDGSVASDGSVTSDGSVASDGGWGMLPDGGCAQVMCQGHLYQCGNCEDDDGDGLIDWADPNCLGPCDNNEAGFDLQIPGGDAQPCALDCYFDQDEGRGNDMCLWDHRCDPLEPDRSPLCRHSDPPPPQATCPSTQTAQCAEVCGPLTPNGCDCFGCCNLPSGGDRWVFIGTRNAAGQGTCNIDTMNDDTACRPCTPVAACLNDCGPCELCLGRTTLPPECFPDDGGVPPGERCEEGGQACGLPDDPPCPSGHYCITGCCQLFG